MIEELPSLTCQNTQKCGLPIELPRPSRRDTRAGQSEWPTDVWSKNFACPRCGHVYRYTKRNADGRKVAQIYPGEEKAVDMGALPLVLCVEVKCGQADCGLPVRIHATSDEPLTKRALAAIAAKWELHITCPADHPLDRVRRIEICSESWEE